MIHCIGCPPTADQNLHGRHRLRPTSGPRHSIVYLAAVPLVSHKGVLRLMQEIASRSAWRVRTLVRLGHKKMD